MSKEQSAVEAAVEQIQELEREIGRLMTPPLSMLTVLKLLPEKRVLVSGPAVVSLPQPDEKEAKDPVVKERIKALKKLKPGDTVLVNGAGALLEIIDVPMPGAEATVRRVFEGDQMEVEGGMGGGAALIYKGMIADCVKPGDRVLMDRTGQVALQVIPKDNTEYSVDSDTGISWDDVGGQAEAKAALREAVEGPLKFSSLYKAYGKRPLKGALLFGPPGNGKTLLAKATAKAIRDLHGKGEADTGFIYVKGPEVLNMWVGATEASIRGLFARAREHKENYGYPAVVFIDEADAILGQRGGRHASVLGSTVVPTFLAEMDGMGDSGAFVLLATNRQDTLDPAVVREGRIDRKIRVGRPGLESAAEILGIHLGRTKIAGDKGKLAQVTVENLFSDQHLLYRVGLKKKGVVNFHMRELVSGALLAGVVDQATSIAIQRDAAKGKASGVDETDLVLAVNQIVRANRGLNHEDALLSFADDHGAEIDAVQPMAEAA